MPPFRISAQSEQQLLTISAQPKALLEEAYTRLAEIKDRIISPKILRATLEKSLPAGVARSLVYQLLAIRIYINHTTTTISETIGSLSLGIKEKKWPEESFNNWERTAPIFERFLALDNIVTVAKAIDLSLDFEHVLFSANIITDIRPIYSPSRTEIIGGIICNRLRIKYDDQQGRQSISISLDKDEIERLKESCIEALKKIDLASNLLKSTGDLPSFVTGEEGYDD